MKTYDIIFCHLPPALPYEIPAAPALLKSCVETAGFSAKTLDLNLDLYNIFCKTDTNKFTRLTNILYPFINYYESDGVDIEELDYFFAESAKKILTLNPTYVGLTVFSSFTHKAVYLLCKQLKKINSDIKIVLGGRGVDVSTKQAKYDLNIPTKINDVFTPFYKFLLDEKLADFYILGDGEDAVVDLLLNQFEQDGDRRYTNDIYSLPIPNYDDYNFDDYVSINNSTLLLPVTGSKGCIRSCEFCDIQKQFGKFRRRNGVDVANEMIALQKKYNISNFHLTDSLANGSLSSLEDFLRTLAEHNRNTDNKITWFSQWICRPKGETKKEIYQLLKESCSHIFIGVESGSNDVLKSINKKTSVEDLYAELELLNDSKVQIVLNLMPGYWSETWNNFLESIKLLKNLHPYLLNGSINAVSLGMPLLIYEKTLLWEKKEAYGIHIGQWADDNVNVWWSDKNPRLTLKERYYRQLILDKVLEELQYPTTPLSTAFSYMVDYLNQKENIDKINEFYKPLLSNS